MSDGGDPACWLDRVCPSCGRLDERPAGATPADRCPACGAVVERAGGHGQDDRDTGRPTGAGR